MEASEETLIHIIPGLLFMVLGPLQFNATLRARHLQWHRWSGRVYLIASLIIGVSALVMSVAMPAIGGLTQAIATTLFALRSIRVRSDHGTIVSGIA